MAPWVRKLFIDVLPKYLFIQRPEQEEEEELTLFDDHNSNAHNKSDSEGSVEIKYLVESPFLGYGGGVPDKNGGILGGPMSPPPMSPGLREDRWG